MLSKTQTFVCGHYKVYNFFLANQYFVDCVTLYKTKCFMVNLLADWAASVRIIKLLIALAKYICKMNSNCNFETHNPLMSLKDFNKIIISYSSFSCLVLYKSNLQFITGNVPLEQPEAKLIVQGHNRDRGSQ